MAADYEFFSRPEWEAARQAYGLRFRERRSLDPTLMYPAVRDGQVDVVSAYSTDGRIDAYDLVTLDDPRQALPPYDAILLGSARAAADAELVAALAPLIGALDDDLMRRANRQVDVDGRPVREAAAGLARHVAGGGG
jgi:osmoprotectant transport system permease protein